MPRYRTDQMGLLVALGGILILALVFGPRWLIGRVLARHGVERPDLPGTGGEFARHLLDEARLADVKVERSDSGDHYDPAARAVRLMPSHHDGKSVAAVAVAAHEVSHALQHARGEAAFARRTAMVGQLVWVEWAAICFLLLTPAVAILGRTPVIALVQIGVALLLLSVRILVHALTLPVEFDASFRKALPILEGRRYLSERDLPAARSVLRAAALTYVASALATLLDLGRWIRFFR